MTSAVDVTFPTDATPVAKQDLRNQLAIIAGEITGLQRSWYDVKLWFGAVGNGVTDDTTAVANAINSGFNLYFPPGTYLVTSLPTMTHSSRVLRGAGMNQTTLKLNGSIVGPSATTALSNIGVVDMTIDCSLVPVGLFYGIGFARITNLVLRNLRIYQPSAGIIVTECTNVWMDNINIDSVKGTLVPADYGLKLASLAGGLDARAYYIRGLKVTCGNTTVKGVVIQGNIKYVLGEGWYISSGLHNLHILNDGAFIPEDVRISDIVGFNSLENGYYLESGVDMSLVGFDFSGADKSGIYVASAGLRAAFAAGRSHASNEHGIFIDGKDIDLVGVSATNANVAAGGHDSCAIGANADSVRIAGGKYGAIEGGSTAALYGISVASGAQRVSVMGPDLVGNATGPFIDNNSPLNAVVHTPQICTMPATAKAALPAAATHLNRMYYVTDATGGASLAYSNGANWISMRTAAAV